MLQQLLPQVLDIVMVSIFLPLVTYLSARIGIFINETTKATKYGAALAKVNEGTLVAVKAVEQEMRPLIKAAAEDGVLTDEEKAKLKAKAVELSLLHFGDLKPLLKDLGYQTTEELKEFVRSKIEASIHDMKKW